jgi:hypothetical protein
MLGRDRALLLPPPALQGHGTPHGLSGGRAGLTAVVVSVGSLPRLPPPQVARHFRRSGCEISSSWLDSEGDASFGARLPDEEAAAAGGHSRAKVAPRLKARRSPGRPHRQSSCPRSDSPGSALLRPLLRSTPLAATSALDAPSATPPPLSTTLRATYLYHHPPHIKIDDQLGRAPG